MIALLGSVLGFGTSFLPQVLAFFQQKQDHKNKLEEMRLRGELAAQGVNLELQVLDKKAEIEETRAVYGYAKPTGGFSAGLAASVRPVITYLFFFFFFVRKTFIMLLFICIGCPTTCICQTNVIPSICNKQISSIDPTIIIVKIPVKVII